MICSFCAVTEPLQSVTAVTRRTKRKPFDDQPTPRMSSKKIEVASLIKDWRPSALKKHLA
jgi:hypothetical protein